MTGGGSYQVKILLDTGASTSVFEVKSYLKDHPEALHVYMVVKYLSRGSQEHRL